VAGKKYYPYILEKENGQLHLAAMLVVFGVHFVPDSNKSQFSPWQYERQTVLTLSC